jgi:hypothetical protein
VNAWPDAPELIDAPGLIRLLGARGIQLRVRDERLVVDGPAAALTIDLLTGLREHKSTLIAALRGENVRGIWLLPDGRVAWTVVRPWAEKRPERAVME